MLCALFAGSSGEHSVDTSDGGPSPAEALSPAGTLDGSSKSSRETRDQARPEKNGQ